MSLKVHSLPTRALARTGKAFAVMYAAGLIGSCGGGGMAAAAPQSPSLAPVVKAETPSPAPGAPVTSSAVPIPSPVPGVTLDTHGVIVDQDGKLLSWITQDKAYDQAAFMSWDTMLNKIPNDPANGQKVYFTHSEYHPDNFSGSAWPNNPAGKNGMLAESASLYYAYSGNRAVITLVQALLDRQLLSGTTPSNYAWANAPWSTAAAGSLTYGNDSFQEGSGVLEPDKLGELGYEGYLRFYKITGDTRYRDAAINCANALVANMRTGNANQSPWPFRVNAQTGAVVESYSSNMIAMVRLFDELIRLDLGNTVAYTTARNAAFNWIMTYPMTNNRWSQYFEDVPVQPTPFSNINQFVPGQTARYLLDNKDKDPSWQTHVAGLITFVENNFGGTDFGEAGTYYGARVISEQVAYKYKMASHTSRYGAVNAIYAAATGDAAAKDKAYRSLNWATYMARSNGGVNEGPAEFANNPPFWFTDGHGDYVRHYMLAMASFPEWAPAAENHLLSTTSVVTAITYAAAAITYSTFDASATDTLKIVKAPVSVTIGGTTLPQRSDLNAAGWVYDAATGVLRIRHDAAGQIVINLEGSSKPVDQPEVVKNAPPPAP